MHKYIKTNGLTLIHIIHSIVASIHQNLTKTIVKVVQNYIRMARYTQISIYFLYKYSVYV
jgi:hypothetical protein